MKLIPLGAALLCSLASVAAAQTGTMKPYTVKGEFENIANKKVIAGALGLKQEHQDLLKRNLFVCYPSDDQQLYYVYGNNDYQNIPSIVTSDAVLQLYHVFFDSTLRWVEENKLEPTLSKMTAALLKDAMAQYQAAKSKDVKEAALRNVAFFGVPASFLGVKTALQPNAEQMVKTELGLAEKHEGFAAGAIFPYKVDYSQFVVRGHYTKSAKLKRFFKAMMWYGLTPFAVKYGDGGKTIISERTMIQSLLVAHSLYGKNQSSAWMSVYEPTTLYAGGSNNIMPSTIRELSKRVYGTVSSVDAFGDPLKLKSFISSVEKLPLAKIRSKLRGDKLPHPDHQFRFMGQRAIPDSYVLQELAVDPRCPSGLDAMAVLGSKRALDILDANPRAFLSNIPAYIEMRKKLIKEFSALPLATWKSNLYYNWLYALKPLLEPTPKGYPSFMYGDAWMDKNLNTALGSWAELRHDTILYGQQSVAEMGGDEEPPFVPQFVEPNVELYSRLIDLTKMSRDGLINRNLLSKPFKASFDQFIGLLDFLKSVSKKELAGQKLTKAEHMRIRHIEGDLADLTETTMKSANGFRSLTQDDLDMALIADVHTARTNALEVGVGRAMHLVAVVPIEGKLYAARGSAMSFYEFLHPISDRLTDEKWKKILSDGKAPDQPFWIKSFFVPVLPKESEE